MMRYEPPPDPSQVDWKIVLEGRAWENDECRSRYELTPGKLELIHGKLLFTDAERLRLLGLLLENCGAEAAVRLGDPGIWRRAVAALDDPEADLRHELRAAHRSWDDAWGDEKAMRRFHERFAAPGFSESSAEERAAAPNSPGDTSSVETHAEAIHSEGDTASVRCIRTLRHRRFEQISGSQWQGLPEVTEVERWRETWARTESGWRLRHRDRIDKRRAVADKTANK